MPTAKKDERSINEMIEAWAETPYGGGLPVGLRREVVRKVKQARRGAKNPKLREAFTLAATLLDALIIGGR